MKHFAPRSPSVVVYVNEFPLPQSGTEPVGQLHSPLPAPLPNRAPMDPEKIHREFPTRWQAYIREHYRNLREIQLTFGVCERTARKWWDGETGCVGGYVAVAVNEHPLDAPRMLFAAE
ncbi:MAG: hypothetical protein ACI8Q6_001966 [Granulosicoccus sp.]|jgi:hypothetical protein